MGIKYQDKQLQLITAIEKKFKSGELPSEIVKAVSNYQNDNRICLTGVAFVPQRLEQIILDKLTKPLKKADNRQYYYIPGSFHITINNVRTINQPPLFNKVDIRNAKKTFEKVIQKHKVFSVEIKRLFELPTSLAISAFSNEKLEKLVLELRKELANNKVADNKKYASSNIVFGNITLCRFTTYPNREFITMVNKLKNTSLGKLEVKTISLITTNSVCRPNKTKIISRYNLS